VRDLHVLILPDGDRWYAQGLQIDYAAQGTSVDDVKKRFERGLIKTLEEHLRQRGNLDALTGRVAPPEIWREYASKKETLPLSFSALFALSAVRARAGRAAKKERRPALPYDRIAYFAPTEARL